MLYWRPIVPRGGLTDKAKVGNFIYSAPAGLLKCGTLRNQAIRCFWSLDRDFNDVMKRA